MMSLSCIAGRSELATEAGSVRLATRSEAVVLDFFFEQLFHSLDVLRFLGFHVLPELLQVVPSICVGDVLIVSP